MESLTELVDLKLLRPDFRFDELDSSQYRELPVMTQKFCLDGSRYKVIISWLQKSVRRNNYSDAMYCAGWLAKMGGIYYSNALNRLLLMVSEDVGLAECGLVDEVLFRYKDGFRNRENLKFLGEIVWLLTHCRHSRYVSMIPQDRSRSTFSIEKDHLREFSKSLLESDVERSVQLAFQAHHFRKRDRNGNLDRKQLEIFKYWKILLEYDSLDTEALLECYEIRMDFLFVTHAIAGVCCGRVEPIKTKIPDLNWKQEFERETNTPRPILNQAIDRHTSIGKKYLGRGMVYFYTHESKELARKLFIEDEESLIEKRLERARIRERVPRKRVKLEPRNYQKSLVRKAERHFKKFNRGRLVVACGAGKTLMSYLIFRKLGCRSALIVVPRLMILNSFFECWQNQHISSGSLFRIRAAVIASDMSNTVTHEQFGYRVLRKSSEIVEYFDSVENPVIFTTYHSLGFVRRHVETIFDFCLCDESHHVKPDLAKSIEQMSKYTLFQTATEKGVELNKTFGRQIGEYTFREAINDGYLCSYEIVLVNCSDPHSFEAVEYCLGFSNRIVVFSKNNTESRDAYEQYIAKKSSKVVAEYVDCNIPMQDRMQSLEKFRNSEKGVIFHCAILGEGVDIPECDGEIFLYPKQQFIDIVQSFGRCLRLNPKDPNKKGKLFLMCSCDDQRREYRSMVSRLCGSDPDVWDHFSEVSVEF